VPEGIRIPPSLKNIYKEIIHDIGGAMPTHGNLVHRAEQWVFLLNAILTVELAQPASHKNIWREVFTDNIIRAISDQKSWVVFLLWWNFAKKKKELIDVSKHIVLEAPHPSPFSAYTWFFWSKHFSQTNKILQQQWNKPIEWLIQ
jgi:uracil-DNA glycosylase